MRNPKQLLKEHNLFSYQAQKGAEAYMQAVAEDITTILATASVRPLHERIAEYINIK